MFRFSVVERSDPYRAVLDAFEVNGKHLETVRWVRTTSAAEPQPPVRARLTGRPETARQVQLSPLLLPQLTDDHVPSAISAVMPGPKPASRPRCPSSADASSNMRARASSTTALAMLPYSVSVARLNRNAS